MIFIFSVASCYGQSLRKIHVRIESLLIINFELIFQSHTAYYDIHIYMMEPKFKCDWPRTSTLRIP